MSRISKVVFIVVDIVSIIAEAIRNLIRSSPSEDDDEGSEE